MTNFTHDTSKSKIKSKRGLSLSLQKKKQTLGTQNDEDPRNTTNYKPIQKTQALNNSIRKNRIKFVQAYQQNQSSQKYKKPRFFKITDEDIKLGGKKSSKKQMKIPLFNNTMDFSNRVSGARNMGLSNWQTDRKTIRQSNILNLNSNLKYFSEINKQNQQRWFETAPLKYESNVFVQRYLFPHNKCDQTQRQTQRQSNLGPISMQNIAVHQQKSVTCIQNKDVEALNDFQRETFKKQTFQKLKKVQLGLDQLLTRANETRAKLLLS